MCEKIAVVDSEDKVVGSASWDELRKDNLLHRGTGILIYNSQGEVFVHRRSKKMKFSPGTLAVFVGGGVTFGESYLENAKKELFEEVGIKDIDLNPIFKAKYDGEKTKFFAEIYSCVYDGSLKLDENEVEEGSFVKIEELQNMLEKENFTFHNIPIIKEYLEKYYENDPAIKNI